MADDDEVSDGAALDPTLATEGPRRSTFTPPAASAVHSGDAAQPGDREVVRENAPAVEPIGSQGGAELPTASPLDRPVRRSLPDDQLTSWAEEATARPGGTLEVIEKLQNELQLREQEAREFGAWERRMLALGTPEALAEIERVRPEFTGVVPTSTGTVPTSVAFPPARPVVLPAPAALPTWDVPAPSATWAPEPDFGTAEGEPAATEPVPRQDDEVTEATIEPEDEPELVTAPELEREPDPDPAPEFEPRPEPQPESEPQPASGPPPLVEPPASGSVRSFDFRPGAPVPEPVPVQSFSFDDLLSGAADVEELRPEPGESAVSPLETLFIEPLPVAAGAPAPGDTGSIPVVDMAYEEELTDDVDETDRLGDGLSGPITVSAAGVAAVAAAISPPSGPISTARVPEGESVLYEPEPVARPVFSLEHSSLEATPVDQRVGRAARLFWLWFAANSSILSLGLGAAIFAVGMSLRQSIVAVLAGVAISFIPLGLTTLAGKRSAQPTMVVSRASFGLIGNVVPAVLALVTRVFWGAVLLWLLASSIAVILVGAQLDGSVGERMLLLISLAVAFLIALLIAVAGYSLLARIQLILSIISAVLIIGLIVMTAKYIDVPQALTTPDGPWLLTITGAVLVFSFVGLVWANSGADLARYQRPGTSGASSMLWATFGTTLPTFLLIGYGALLAASDSGIASGFLASPLDTLALMLPNWYPVPLIAATALSLLSGITLSLYSAGFALQSIGVHVTRQWSVVVVGVLLGGLAVLLTFGVSGGINELFRDAATSLAVPTAAWTGIFAAETMIRNRRFASASLLARGGIYPDVRWVNLIGFLLISAIGFGFTSATVTWLSWQGYAFTLLGVPLDSDLGSTDLGVLVALALGLILPIVAGIPAIRRQEAARG